MYEIRRILTNKKVIITFMLMLAINIILFFRETDNEDFLNVKPSHNEYINGYSNKYEIVKRNADMLISGKEYSDMDSFSGRNIIKTLEDFEVVKNIEVTYTDETAADSVIEFKFTDYAMIVCVISIIMSMYDERRKGVWDYVYSARNGRKKLALYKLCSLTAGVTIASMLMYAGNFVCAFVKHGSFGDLGRAAQSNENFENLTIKVSLGGAFLFSILIKICVLIFIGILLWLLISNVTGQVIPFLIFGGIMFLQYYAYSAIDIHSAWRNFKYINIFGVLDSQEMLGTYVNLNIFGYAVNRVSFLCILLAVLLLLIFCFMICMGKRRPFTVKKSNRTVRVFQKSSSIFLQELYKTIISQKVWVIFILLIAGAYMLTRPQEIMYDYSMVIYNQYMENLSGGVTQEKIDYLSEEISVWESQLEELWLKAETSTDDSEIRNIYEKIKNIERAKSMTESVYQDAVEMYELKADGYEVGFVNNTGYDMLIGGGGKAASNTDALIILAFMILTVANFWSYDNQCEMSGSIQSCVNGREKYSLAKYVTAAIIVAVAIIILFVLRCIEVNYEYGLSNFNLSVKSLGYFREGVPNMPIWAFLAVFVLIRFLNTFLVAIIVMYISSKARNNVISIAVNVAVILIPSCLYYIGMDFFAYISVARGISVNGMWQRRNIFNSDFVIQEVIILIVGIAIGVWHICGTRIIRRRSIDAGISNGQYLKNGEKMENRLEFINVSKRYGEKEALSEFSYVFTPGVYGMLGPNGAGKSTFMNLLTDSIGRTGGSILYNGKDILELGGKFRGVIGYMPQKQGMYDNFSAERFMYYMSGLKGIKKSLAKEQIEKYLKLVGLYDVRNKKLGGFSGGMRQRILFASVCLGNPQIMILDEPTAGLDPEERIKIRNYISELAEDKIVILSTHIVSDIESIANKIILLKGGRIIKSSVPEKLIESVSDKIFEIKCSEEVELKQLTQKYKNGNVCQSRDGIIFRIVSEECPEKFSISNREPDMEDVYMYYFNEK